MALVLPTQILQLLLQGRQFVKIGCKEVAGFKEKNTESIMGVYRVHREMRRALHSFFRAAASCRGVNLTLVTLCWIQMNKFRSRAFPGRSFSDHFLYLGFLRHCHLWGSFMLGSLLYYFAVHHIWELCGTLYLLLGPWSGGDFLIITSYPHVCNTTKSWRIS